MLLKGTPWKRRRRRRRRPTRPRRTRGRRRRRPPRRPWRRTSLPGPRPRTASSPRANLRPRPGRSRAVRRPSPPPDDVRASGGVAADEVEWGAAVPPADATSEAEPTSATTTREDRSESDATPRRKSSFESASIADIGRKLALRAREDATTRRRPRATTPTGSFGLRRRRRPPLALRARSRRPNDERSLEPQLGPPVLAPRWRTVRGGRQRARRCAATISSELVLRTRGKNLCLGWRDATWVGSDDGDETMPPPLGGHGRGGGQQRRDRGGRRRRPSSVPPVVRTKARLRGKAVSADVEERAEGVPPRRRASDRRRWRRGGGGASAPTTTRSRRKASCVGGTTTRRRSFRPDDEEELEARRRARGERSRRRDPNGRPRRLGRLVVRRRRCDLDGRLVARRRSRLFSRSLLALSGERSPRRGDRNGGLKAGFGDVSGETNPARVESILKF